MNKKIISVFTLIMINVIAVDSLRSLPATAQYGYSIIFYYLIAGIMFFIPSALVAGELATTWPEAGGIYVWAKHAFGQKTAFALVFLQWLYNVCWYPTILSLMAVTLAYCIDQNLANNKIYIFTTINIMFWLIIIINCFGLKISNLITNIFSIIGIILPISFIIILGVIYIIWQMPAQINFNSSTILPNFSNPNSLVFFTSVVFSLMGIEMSAVHANDVHNPQKSYPKAILLSSIIIIISLVFASIAIAIVVPHQELSVVTGLLAAYQLFFIKFHIVYLMPIVAILIVIGGAGSVSAWLLGPVKALLSASIDNTIPKYWSITNKFNVPYRLIILQGIIFSTLSLVFIFMPAVNSGFWFLSTITSQLALIFYIGLFICAIVLRYKYPNAIRPFRIPLGKITLWLTTLSGVLICIVTIGVGFLTPESNISWQNSYKYYLALSIIIACAIPYILSIMHFKNMFACRRAYKNT